MKRRSLLATLLAIPASALSAILPSRGKRYYKGHITEFKGESTKLKYALNKAAIQVEKEKSKAYRLSELMVGESCARIEDDGWVTVFDVRKAYVHGDCVELHVYKTKYNDDGRLLGSERAYDLHVDTRRPGIATLIVHSEFDCAYDPYSAIAGDIDAPPLSVFGGQDISGRGEGG